MYNACVHRFKNALIKKIFNDATSQVVVPTKSAGARPETSRARGRGAEPGSRQSRRGNKNGLYFSFLARAVF